MQLEEMSTEDVKQHLKKDTLVVIPVGATEQHGPANPLGTDFMLATYVARKACEQTSAICAPPVPIGVSEHHSGFAGTLWFSPRLFVEVFIEYALALAHHGFNRIIFVNGHGGNTGVLSEIVATLYTKHKLKPATVNWYDLVDVERIKELFPNASFAHAEAVETSANLGAHPHLVQLDKIADISPAKKWGKHVAEILVPAYTHEFAPDGVVGTLDDISEESGKEIVEMSISRLVEFINAYREY